MMTPNLILIPASGKDPADDMRIEESLKLLHRWTLAKARIAAVDMHDRPWKDR